jgi:hypothetical protein
MALLTLFTILLCFAGCCLYSLRENDSNNLVYYIYVHCFVLQAAANTRYMGVALATMLQTLADELFSINNE